MKLVRGFSYGTLAEEQARHDALRAEQRRVDRELAASDLVMEPDVVEDPTGTVAPLDAHSTAPSRLASLRTARARLIAELEDVEAAIGRELGERDAPRA